MSGPNLRTKPKFIRLYTMLGISPVLARGLLEYLWDSASDTGDPIIGDAATVEAAAGWTDEPGKLCEALLKCGGIKSGFIEECPGHQGAYRLHDLAANASDEQIRLWRRRRVRAERAQWFAEQRANAACSRSTATELKPEVETHESKPQQPAAAAKPSQPTESQSPTSLPVTKAAIQKSNPPAKRPMPDIPTLLEVKEHLARYGFKGNAAGFLLYYQPESLPPKEAADWKFAAVEWLRRQEKGNEIDRLLPAVR